MAVGNITNISRKEMHVEIALCTFMCVPSLQPREKPGVFSCRFSCSDDIYVEDALTQE